MTRVTEYWIAGMDDPPFGTRLWVSDAARKEIDEIVDVELGVIVKEKFLTGWKDYRGPWLHPEGEGTWAVGPKGKKWGTVRIGGYFPDERNREDFVCGGAWSGKTSRGNKRPGKGDTVIERVLDMKSQRVEFVQQ